MANVTSADEVVIVRGEGCEVFDRDGRRYLEAPPVSGIGHRPASLYSLQWLLECLLVGVDVLIHESHEVFLSSWTFSE
jgi:hypothetical protein